MIHRLLKHHRFMQGYLISVIAHVFTRPGFIFMIFVTLSAILGASGLFFWIEAPANPRVTGFVDALYFSTSTFTTVGYGDIAPITRADRILAIAMMLGGSLIYVSFVALFSSSLIELDLLHRERQKTSKTLK